MLVRGISSYAIVGIVATMVFSVTYASSPILGPVGFPRLFQPKHRPSAVRQHNLTEAQCAGFEPAGRINAGRLATGSNAIMGTLHMKEFFTWLSPASPRIF